jgi:hypothetical protein
MFLYGMRLRGFSIGCQPSGVVKRMDDVNGRYWDVIAYDRKLTDAEISAYDLDYIGEAAENEN